jgi:hypothetical protein
VLSSVACLADFAFSRRCRTLKCSFQEAYNRGFVEYVVLCSAVTIAAALNTLVTLILKAGQPAAAAPATTLCTFHLDRCNASPRLVIVAGVPLIAASGAPIRRFRLKHTETGPAAEKYGCVPSSCL